MTRKELQDLLTDENLEIARKAIEDALIDRRDSGISILRNNGLVIKYKSGNDSDIIRMGAEEAIAIGMEAIMDKVFGEL